MSKTKQKELTIEQLRSFEGFQNVSETEAIEIINSLKALSIILYESYKEGKEQYD